MPPPPQITASVMDAILTKMRSPDMDFRLMALIDLQKDVQTGAKVLDEPSENMLVAETLRLVEDENSEVKNMAVNTLSVLVSRIKKPSQVNTVVSSLLKSAASKDEQQRDIADTALKKVLSVLPLSSPIVPEVIEKVSANVLKQIQVPDVHVQHVVELIDILSLIFTRFPSQIEVRLQLQTNALHTLLNLLASPRQHIRKRCTHALAFLAPMLSDANFTILNNSLLSVLGEGAENGNGMDVDSSFTTSELTKKTSYASLVGSLTKSCTAKIAKELGGLMPCLLKLTEELESEDALEASMTTLETIVQRCPAEVTPFLSQVAARASILLKYDPNYVVDDEDEEENGMDEDEEDEEEDAYDEEFGEQPSDDDDSSWKARRSAAKLIHALISSRPELLPTWHKTFAPLLTSRLGEREESVRVEIFADWEALLQQTAIASGAISSIDIDAPASLKRKRQESNSSQEIDIAGTSPLAAELPALIRATLKQSISKSPATKERTFSLLKLIVDSRRGGLEQHSAAIANAVQKAFDQVASGQAGGATSSSLIATVLAFLGTYFEHQAVNTYADTIVAFVPEIVKCMTDKYARISIQAFSTASHLARGLRPQATSGTISPLKSNYKPSIESLYAATAQTVEGNSADAAVRNAALVTLGDLLVHEGDLLQGQHEQCFKLISERLGFDVTRSTALEVVGEVAGSALCRGTAFDNWLPTVLDTIPTLLRRSQGAGRVAVIRCLKRVLARTGGKLPTAVATTLLAELKICLTRERQDAPALPTALQVITQILVSQPQSRAVFEKDTLPVVLNLLSSSGTSDSDTMDTSIPGSLYHSSSPLIQASALEALLELFAAYSRSSDKDAGVRLVAQLFGKVSTSGKMPMGSSPALAVYPLVAKAVGVIMSENTAVFAYFAPELRQPLEKKNTLEGQVYLTLLAVGEAGRTIDQNSQAKEWEKLFGLVTKLMDHSVELIKSAAAFSLGNIAVGNIGLFLPQIVKGVTSPNSAALGLLYLHALKETIEHCSSDQIEGIADSLWIPLLGRETEEQDDGTRNVRAACIGKLATAKPAIYLPELHSRIKSESVTTRATIAAAIRYTLVDDSAAYDDLLSSLLLDFLLLMEDADHNVRRLAVTSLNAAASNKPEVVQAHLPALLPALYAEAQMKPELLREYMMGPFKVIQDDGINNRKAAYETMLTLLKTCLQQIDRNQMLEKVLDGLKDEDEVKVLCCVLLQRLVDVAPAAVLARLDVIAERLKPLMESLVVTKDTVAQDVQRKEELQKAAYRAVKPIYKISSSTGSNRFNDWAAMNLAKWKEFGA